MKEPFVELAIVPCLVLVSVEAAATPSEAPIICEFKRSVKLVSLLLKPVVCEFAMLPEMFCSAKACACMPLIEAVSESNAPMRSFPWFDQTGTTQRGTSRNGFMPRRGPHAILRSLVPKQFVNTDGKQMVKPHERRPRRQERNRRGAGEVRL